jgi:hypothetical protein
MPENRPLFEEMLSSYPAEKRELARAAYNRFVDGDTAHFFTQLFLLLDVYANFANRIPQAMKAASDDVLATVKDIREEIGLLAQTVETKSVSLGNATEDTRALCLATQHKCEAAAQRLEKLTRDIGQQVDTKAIVESIRKGVDAGVQAEVIKPFMQRTEQLAEDVLPTLERIRNANEEAGRVWPGRIWKMALACGLVLGLAVAIVGTTVASLKIKRHYDATLAEQIVSAANTLTQNKTAFQQLAVANAPVYVVRSSDASTGQTIPSGFCLYIKGAVGAEMRGSEGCIFFNSGRPQKDIDQLLRETQEQLDKFNRTGK